MSRVLLLLLACGIWNHALGQVALSLASGSGTPGSIVNLNLSINTSGTLPASLQWTMTHDANVVSSIAVSAGPVALAAGKSVSCAGVGTVTCIAFGINSTTISNGVVAIAAVTIAPSTLSNSTPIGISNVVASSASGSQLPSSGSGNTLGIVQPSLTAVNITTNPPGLQIVVDGSTLTAPRTFQWVPGSQHTIGTNSPQGAGSSRNVFAGWNDGGAQSHTITTPSSTATYTANFTTQYLLTTTVSPAGTGSITRNPPSADGYYNSGAVVQLTASASSGQQFSSWAGDATGSANPTSVTMNGARNVTANFTAAPQGITITTIPSGLQIVVDGSTLTAPQTFQWTPGSQHTIGTNSPQGAGSSRNVFAGWSDGGAQSHTITTPSSTTTYTANFTTQHLLTTTVSPAGTGSVTRNPPSADGYYNSGAAVQLTASASSGQQFSSWAGDASGSANPTSVTMSGARNVTANFTAAPQGITITTIPSGLQIVVDGSTLTAPQTFQWTPGSQHNIGVVSPQVAGTTRNVFASWSDGGAQTHTITTPSAAATYTANFTLQYLLTTTATPGVAGSILKNPASADGFYNSGTVVQLTAVASTGQQFSSWAGDASGTANPTSVTMSAARNVIGNFTASPQGITITTIPSGLQIVVDGTTMSSPQTFQWTPGSQHTISTNSPQGSGPTRSVFAGWSDGGAQSHTITTPSSTTTYTANFTTQYLLTTTSSPAGTGSVSKSPASADGYYNSGTVVTLTATASPGQQFSSWSGDAIGTANPTSVTMSNARNVTANFTSAPQGITITTIPSGLQIVVDGTTLTAPQTFQWTSGSQHTIGTSSPQVVGASRNVYSHWSDGGAQSHTITTPSSSTTYTANFTVQYLLTTTAVPGSGGSISKSPTSTDGYYSSGTVVQLTATASPGQQFSSWGGDASGTANPASVTMSSGRNVTANFTTAPQGVTVTTIPSGLQIIVDGTTLLSPQTFQWASGSQHSIGTISVQGVGNTRNVFANWSDGGAQTHTITASTGSSSYTANFTTQYQVTKSVSPIEGGSVQIIPSSPDGFYNSGTTLQFAGFPNSGYQFSSWTGLSTNSNPANVTLSNPLSVTGNFNTGCTYSLNRTRFDASSEGDFGRIQISTGNNCEWTASSNSSWVTFNGPFGGVGRGKIGFTVASNPTFARRSATVTVGTASVVVNQASASCGSNIVVSNSVMPALGSFSQSLSFNINAPVNCQWSLAVAPEWVSLNSSFDTVGEASKNVHVNVSDNSTPNPRLGSIQIGGFEVPMMQVGTTTPQIYSDVPPTNTFVHNINLLALSGINVGCTTNQFCPDVEATRGESAKIIITTLLGESFSFPPAPYFTDVPASHAYFKYIQKMRELGITVGCTFTEYCPSGLITRGQMATFIIRAKLRAADSTVTEPPYPVVPFFQDVPNPHIFYPYIQKLKQTGITAGCSLTGFCPDLQTTRGQLAAFVTKALLAP